MEYSIVDLATKTYVLLASVDRFLLEQGSLVNKSKRQLFPVVLQRQTSADALARTVQGSAWFETTGEAGRDTGQPSSECPIVRSEIKQPRLASA